MENFDIGVKSIADISKFKSMYLRTINSETEVVPTIDAFILRYLANIDHVFQIGDVLYYFTYEIPMKFVILNKNGVVFDIANAKEIYPIFRNIDSEISDIGSRAITD